MHTSVHTMYIALSLSPFLFVYVYVCTFIYIYILYIYIYIINYKYNNVYTNVLCQYTNKVLVGQPPIAVA